MSALAGTLTVLISLLASILAIVFSVIVVRADPRGPMNRRLAALLAIDGAFFLGLATSDRFPLPDLADVLVVQLLLLANASAHLLFIATLQTPLTRRLRGRAPFRAVLAGAGALYLVIVLRAIGRARAGGPLDDSDLGIGFGWPLMAFSSLFALVASVDALRRTSKEGPAHRRARSFMLAFGTRDLAVGVGILGYGATEAMGRLDIVVWMPIVISAGAVLFVCLLTYGILSTQLFDIDLRIKWTISRGTVASLALACVFVVSKLVEAYASRNLGFVAGAVAAGLLLFAAPRLNKLGDKVANTAMPQVQPTSDYLAYKKIEVYRAAVEAAHETGGLTEKDRASLDRLRAKLGLKTEDASAVERDVLAPA